MSESNLLYSAGLDLDQDAPHRGPDDCLGAQR
jgi:hypothetical protein